MSIKTEEETVECVQQDGPDDAEVTKLFEEKYSNVLNTFDRDTMIRFVRGYGFIKDKKDRIKETTERLDNYVKITTKDYDYPNILSPDWEKKEEICRKGWPNFLYGEDKQGHPIWYDQMTATDPKELEKAFKAKDVKGTDKKKMMHYRLRCFKRVANRKRFLQNKYDKLIYKHILIVDISKATISAAWSYKSLASEIIGIEQNVFPETCYKAYIINAGWLFSRIWGVYKHFVHPITQKKIKILSDQKAFLKAIQEDVNLDQIPKFYGGKGTLPIVQAHDSEEYHARKYYTILKYWARKDNLKLSEYVSDKVICYIKIL